MKIKNLLCAVFFLALIDASCAAFTPPYNPHDWPCGDPHSQWCAGTSPRACCLLDVEVCGAAGSRCPENFCCADADAPAPAARRMRPMTVAR